MASVGNIKIPCNLTDFDTLILSSTVKKQLRSSCFISVQQGVFP